jgi:DNA mismatch endonuclease (patch repair protein)
MADLWSKAKRSEVMARIRGQGNRSTEQRLAALFRTHGITGWRRHLPLPGRPDFTFRAQRLIIFVDGCFWHGCPRHGSRPRQNGAFWRKKIARNRQRDRAVNRDLRRRGWRVVRIWEHELHGSLSRKVQRLLEAGNKPSRS